jgi:hypothetical protein
MLSVMPHHLGCQAKYAPELIELVADSIVFELVWHCLGASCKCVQKQVATARDGLHYHSLVSEDQLYQPLVAQVDLDEQFSLTLQLLGAILGPGHVVPSLRHHVGFTATNLSSHPQTSSKGLLQSGLRFLAGHPPHPADHDHVILVLLGGITFAEIKALQEAAARSTQCRITICSTCVASPDLVARSLLAGHLSKLAL